MTNSKYFEEGQSHLGPLEDNPYRTGWDDDVYNPAAEDWEDGWYEGQQRRQMKEWNI